MNAIDKAARDVTVASGSAAAVIVSVSIIAIWLLLGSILGFDEKITDYVNVAMSIVTFVMVFFIQNSQNRDTAAIQAKLDEIIAATSEARNELVGIERDSSESEIQDRRKTQDEC